MISLLCSRPTLLILFLALLATGCSGGGGGVTISGTVTYNGTPLEKGAITFLPEDGKGASSGAMIEKGQYKATNVSRGKNRVQVVASSTVQTPATQEEAMKMPSSQLKSNAPNITLDDEGNNHVKEITESQIINIDLKGRRRN